VKSIKSLREEGKGFFRIISYIVIAFFIISIFIIGSLSGMLGSDQTSFITVEGREIMDRNVKNAISEKMRGMDNPSQKQFAVYQNVQGEINRLVLLLESRNQGLEPKLSTLAEALEGQYRSIKSSYEKSTNTPYPYSFVDFLEMMKKDYMVQVLVANITSGNYIDELSVKKEYFLRNTTSQVEYIAMDFQNYVKKLDIPAEQLEKVYAGQKKQFLQSIEAKVLTYDKQEKAAEALKKIRANAQFKEEIFKKAPQRTFRPGSIRDFFVLKATPAGQASDVFQLGDSYAIANVLQQNYLPIEKLDPGKQLELKKMVIEQERLKYFQEFKKMATEKLEKVENFQKAGSGVLSGKTLPISIAADEPVKNAKDEKPISWLSPENKAFFNHAFRKEGTVSPILEWGEQVYRVRVLEIKKPAFPIAAEERAKLVQSLTDREARKIQQDFIFDVRKHYDIEYNWENLNSLFGIQGGQL
jgi:hypothetical protein